MSGAPSSISFLSLLLRLITLLYKSLRSLVANLPPSSGTIGRSSGGITGSTSRIIHSGRALFFLNASRSASFFVAASFFWPFELLTISRVAFASASISILESNSLITSAPIPALKAFEPHLVTASRYSLSFKICLNSRSVSPGSVTTNDVKYNTCSRPLSCISRSVPILDGTPLKYQI